jgi:hypothetical protein
MLVWDQDYLLHGVFISMVNNNINGLEPSWDDKSLIYSPVLLGGNPICNNLQISSNPQISYHQQLNCRYNSSVLNILGMIWIIPSIIIFMPNRNNPPTFQN